jgi:hypothetical protein
MFEPFSKRTKREAGKGPEVYTYDDLPSRLRNQIIHICNNAVGQFGAVAARKDFDVFYSRVQLELCQELGLLQLTEGPRPAVDDIWNFFLGQRDVEQCLDIIEIVFACMVQYVRADSYVNFDGMAIIGHAADELNARFQEHAVGYEFRENRFIRIDSGLMHKEAVTPAMVLLREPFLSGANDEFSKAHAHFRHQRFGECMNECLKAFESTMKGICHKHGWAYDKDRDTASKLLEICKRNGLFPSYLETSLAGLVSVLGNVATARNRMSGHGQGPQPIQIPVETAAFVLNSTAANILYLASLEKRLK